MGLLEFYLATRDANEVLLRKNQSSRQEHLEVRHACYLTETKIRSRCRGLLQVTQAQKGNRDLSIDDKPELLDYMNILTSVLVKKVGFLHLSIRQYLESTDFVTSCTPRDMEAFMASSLGLLKLLKPHQLFQKFMDKLDQELHEEPPWSALGRYLPHSEEGLVGYSPIDDFFHYARIPEISPNSYGSRLLIELDRICT